MIKDNKHKEGCAEKEEGTAVGSTKRGEEHLLLLTQRGGNFQLNGEICGIHGRQR